MEGSELFDWEESEGEAGENEYEDEYKNPLVILILI